MKPRTSVLILSLLTPLPLASGWSQGAQDDEPMRCVSLSRIDHTEVIDNRNIVFYLKGGSIYVNRLDRACSRLDRGAPFSYRTSTGQLCAVDMITVLEDFGAGLSRGASCSLGVFMPADEDYIAMLKGEEPDAEVTVEEIEVEE